MDWSDIRIFLQVVRDGTITKAARSLGLDHSTISRRIGRLEKEAGVPLFGKAGRRLSITPAGTRMASAAEKMEAIVLREAMTFLEEASRIAGTVRIGTTEEFGVHYLAPRISRLVSGHPDLAVELVPSLRDLSLAAREVDILVTMNRPTSGDVRFKKLISFSQGIFGAKGSFGNSAKLPNCLEELAEQPWCSHVREFAYPDVLEHPEDHFSVTPRYRTASISAQLATVLTGTALAILPCYLVQDQKQVVRIMPDYPFKACDYWLAVHDDLAGSARVRSVMDAIDRLVASDISLFRSSRSVSGASAHIGFPPERGA
ncbi:MAG: hypothetical protein DI636_06770 [Pelagerythrobacter marensis]|nr:MAG: hypothetical protein DI636_06770 [Pelagerythrobacter marensis]